jgi:hypothetical protein
MDKKTPLLSDPAEDIGSFGNPKLRFTIFYAAVIFLLTTLPLWLSLLIPKQIAVVNSIIILSLCFLWLSIAFNAVMNYSRLNLIPTPPLEGLQVSRQRKFLHVVVVPCYLDPIDILFDCIGSLLMQTDPSSLLVVVAFEVKTPELEAKRESVKVAFEKLFGHFLITVHTVDKAKEIAGGCSNKNHALHSAHQYLRDNRLLDDPKRAVTITTCDTDSLFHPNYFTVLEAAYNARNPSFSASPAMCVWQPPLFYNWDLDERPFFNRVTGLMRMMMMLGGLISFNLNPMSIFSYPLELGLKSGFINPRYGVDDIIAKVRWMCSTNEQVPVLLLPVPVISGPTIGTTFWLEIEEWARQIRRWIVGSSESFHYFVIHWRGEPFFSGIWWFLMFFMYYAVLLCSAGLFTILAGIPLPWVTYQTIPLGGGYEFSLKNIGLLALLLQYLAFGVAFVLDRLAIRMMTIKENISIFRNLLHWLAAPLVLLLYSAIAFWAIMKFVFVGKGMAKHDMAAKDGMGANTVATSPMSPGASSAQDSAHDEKEIGTIADLPPPRGAQGIPSFSASSPPAAIATAPGEDVEYDDDVLPSSYRTRSRSTSVSQEAGRHSFQHRIAGSFSKSGALPMVPSGGSRAQPPVTAPQPVELLCEMPERFRFGEYSMETSTARVVNSNALP